MSSKNIDDYIHPLHINGLAGRVLYMPSEGVHDREIIVVYGHHSSLERWWGLAQAFHEYGSVVMPDLPGFGGMDSFYKIGRKATLDEFADYLAAYVRMRCKRRNVSLVGISWGFLVVTRMLQRYPDLSKKVDLLVSAVGFMRYDDFNFSRTRHHLYVTGANIVATPPFYYLMRAIGLNRHTLRLAYAKTHNAKVKFAQANGDQKKFDKMMDMEIVLWHANDVRTHFKTTVEMLTVDNCNKSVDLPVWHCYTENDNYLNNQIVEQQMQIVFNAYRPAQINSAAHAPSVVASKTEAAVLIPPVLRKILQGPSGEAAESNPKSTAE